MSRSVPTTARQINLPRSNVHLLSVQYFLYFCASAGDRTMDMRELKALEIVARSKIVFQDGVWLVPSQSVPKDSYRVVLSPEPSCTCEDFSLTLKPCKHIIAA